MGLKGVKREIGVFVWIGGGTGLFESFGAEGAAFFLEGWDFLLELDYFGGECEDERQEGEYQF